YKIKANSECTITLTGSTTLPENFSITIKPGFNWIGFPGTEGITINEVFANFEPANGDVIKLKSGSSATYVSNMGWLGGNMVIQPGQGYIYQSKASNTKSLSF
ncbi:MAG: hypothetical protein IKR29_05995, partial [Bacteroidales bacterium]|nr:hypothetical protein [Bacteroidales bacterium]